jgi:hypothetical protein
VELGKAQKLIGQLDAGISTARTVTSGTSTAYLKSVSLSYRSDHRYSIVRLWFGGIHPPSSSSMRKYHSIILRNLALNYRKTFIIDK